MTRSPALHCCTLACATVLWLSSAWAATVHTWVDADGVRHYSDAPPADGKDAKQIEIEDTPQPPAGDDYYSIVNQWNRTRAEREADTAQQIERERVEAAASPPPPPPEPSQSEPSRGVIYPGAVPYGFGAGMPPYGGWPVQGRHHHHHGYEDEPPLVSAPPPPGRTSAGNPRSINLPAPALPSQR